MNSTITAKYQTTIPKGVREVLGLAVHDALEWVVERDKVVVYPVHKGFLQYRGAVAVGGGDVEADIEQARDARMEKYR